MFGINGTEMIILIIVALVVIGPQRMPEYAQRLRDAVRKVRDYAQDARRAMKDELGDEFKDVDWEKLDPRQYDPRRIVKEALAEEPSGGANTTGQEQSQTTAHGGTNGQQTASDPVLVSPFQRHTAQKQQREITRGAPFDPEAT